MLYIDMHCDTLMKLASRNKRGDLYSSGETSVDLERLIKSQALIQFFAIFMLREKTFHKYNIPIMDDEHYIDDRVEYFNHYVKIFSDKVMQVRSRDDLHKLVEVNKTGLLLTLEDGRFIENDISLVEKLYAKGIRLIGLLWNEENSLGYPNSRDIKINALGLKSTGIEVIREMNRLGMIIDTSHLNDKGFYDVAHFSNKPFVASHSNARALSNHPRNLTDEMIKIISDKGGVIGINYMPQFLKQDSNKSLIKYMIQHIKYIRDIGGIDCIGLGSDLDGIHGELEIESCDKHYLLFEGLRKAGFSQMEIEKITYKNVLRVLNDILK